MAKAAIRDEGDEERVTTLREGLIEMRSQLIRQLSFEIEGGSLALLASVGGALAAIDRAIAHRSVRPLASCCVGFGRTEEW